MTDKPTASDRLRRLADKLESVPGIRDASIDDSGERVRLTPEAFFERFRGQDAKRGRGGDYFHYRLIDEDGIEWTAIQVMPKREEPDTVTL